MTAASGRRAPDGPFKLPRPRQIEELSPDQLVAVIWRLAMELCVLRDRLSTHERLLAEKSVLSPEEIDSYAPPKDEVDARLKARNELIQAIINDLS